MISCHNFRYKRFNNNMTLLLFCIYVTITVYMHIIHFSLSYSVMKVAGSFESLRYNIPSSPHLMSFYPFTWYSIYNLHATTIFYWYRPRFSVDIIGKSNNIYFIFLLYIDGIQKSCCFRKEQHMVWRRIGTKYMKMSLS